MIDGRKSLYFLIAPMSLALVSGCDQQTPAANRSVQNALALGAAQVGDSPDKAIGSLQPASGNQQASPSLRAETKAALAAAQNAAAAATIRELDEKNIQVFRLIHEIELLGIRISVGNTLESGYSLLNPKTVAEEYKNKITQAKGDVDKPAWFTDEKGGVSLPTLAHVKQESARLQTEISGEQAKIDELKKKHQAALNSAIALQEKADDAVAADAVKTYTKASNQRKVASDLSAQIETAQAKLIPLQNDLSISQKQEEVVTQYIAAVEAQGKLLAEGWGQLHKAAGEQQQLSRRIVDGKGKIIKSITAKSVELTDLLQGTKALHDQAEAQLTSAVQNLNDAATIANQLCTDVRLRKGDADGKSKFDSDIYKHFLDVFSGSYFKLQQSVAENSLANLYASEYAVLAAKQQIFTHLVPVLKNANVPMPGGLMDPKLDESLKTTHTRATELYTSASERLAGVSEASMASDPRGTQARVARIYTLYDWAQLLKEDGAKPAAAKAKFDEAVVLRDQVMQNSPGIALSLPDELTPPPPKPAAPATPATQPTASAM